MEILVSISLALTYVANNNWFEAEAWRVEEFPNKIEKGKIVSHSQHKMVSKVVTETAYT